MRRTKIICTIGPASESEEMLVKLYKAGMNMARLNFSHGTHEDHLAKIQKIHKLNEENGWHIGIMLDTKGPEIRVGTMENGAVEFKKGDLVTVTPEDIIGNHVAVVDRGRAGASVSIKDSIPTTDKKGAKRMGNQSIWHRMFNAFVKDAEPAEVLEAMDAMKGCAAKTEDEEPAEKPDKFAALEAKVNALAEKLDKLASAKVQDEEEEEVEEKDVLDELVEELKAKKTEDEPDEESVTVEPEEIDEEEEDVEEKDEMPEEEIEAKEEIKTKDAMVRFLSRMKPIVASLPAGQRKRAADAMAKAYREAKGVPSGEKVSYSALAKRKAADKKANTFAEFGENCRKRNPHYKG